MQDADTMTLGMWVDYIIEYNNMQVKAKKQAEDGTDERGQQVHRRMATQADFDNF